MSIERERRNLWLAVLASLLLHVVIALSLAAFNGTAMPLPSDDDRPVELTMVDLSATPPPSVRANPPYMETDPAKESAEQPKEKTFESNANSIAASRLPALGDAPLPSQEGKDRPFVNLQTQDLSLATEAEAGCSGKTTDASASAHGSADRDGDAETEAFRDAQGYADRHASTADDAGTG